MVKVGPLSVQSQPDCPCCKSGAAPGDFTAGRILAETLKLKLLSPQETAQSDIVQV